LIIPIELKAMKCPYCQSERSSKNGVRTLKTQQKVQYYRCGACHRNFNQRTGTPMARLRTPSQIVGFALHSRTEGMGVRATGRVYDKSHSTIINWEKRVANQVEKWSPPAPKTQEITLEGDEVYTRVGENLPPQ
jgi:transposase-like protein